MRLSELKWDGSTLGKYKKAHVKCSQYTYRIWDWQVHYSAICNETDYNVFKSPSLLELACWLADKEPRDPPQT
jgi:hypothetical protein